MPDDFDTLIRDLITRYDDLIDLTKKEREFLIQIDIENLLKILEKKQSMINSISLKLGQLKLAKANKLILSVYIEQIRKLSNKLFYHNKINAKIAQQHLAFSTAMLNFYTSFMQTNQTYNNKALIPYKSSFNRIG